MDRDEGPYRPFLVKTIATMEALGGLGELCWGIALVALSDLIPKGNIGLSQMGTSGLLLYGYSSIVLAIISFLVAAGVYSLAGFGRKLALFCMVIGLIIPILVAALLGQLIFIFNLILYPMFMLYLMQAETKKLYK